MVQVIFTAKDSNQDVRVSLGGENYVSLFDLPRETKAEVVDRQGVYVNAVNATTGEVVGKTHVYMESGHMKADGHMLNEEETIQGIMVAVAKER